MTTGEKMMPDSDKEELFGADGVQKTTTYTAGNFNSSVNSHRVFFKGIGWLTVYSKSNKNKTTVNLNPTTTTTKKSEPLKIVRKNLMFSGSAMAKLLWCRDKGGTEIAGFGISSKEDPLYIKEFCLVKQDASVAYVEMDDDGLVEFIEKMDDRGLDPCEYLRIWIHTHPGSSPSPSGKDEETFRTEFSNCNWSVMAILARGNQFYARIKMNEINFAVDIEHEVNWSDMKSELLDVTAWETEFEECVKTTSYSHSYYQGMGVGNNNGWEDYDGFETMVSNPSYSYRHSNVNQGQGQTNVSRNQADYGYGRAQRSSVIISPNQQVQGNNTAGFVDDNEPNDRGNGGNWETGGAADGSYGPAPNGAD